MWTLDNISVVLENAITGLKKLEIDTLDLELSNATIDSASLENFFPFRYRNIKFNSTGVWVDINPEYLIASGAFSFNARRQSIDLLDVQLKPKYTQENFAKRYDYQKSWLALTLHELSLKGIDFDSFEDHGAVFVEHAILDKPNLLIYKDKSKPEPAHVKKTLPASSIGSIPWPIGLDTLIVQNGRVTINEKGKYMDQPSELFFSEMNATITGFTNDPERIKKQPELVTTASCLVMGEGEVNTTLNFDLLSKTDQFRVLGTMGPMDALKFNSVLEPMMLIKVTQGHVHSVDFAFSSDDTESLGTLNMDYEQVKVEVMQTDHMEKKSALQTMAVNTVVRGTNLRDQSTYQSGTIQVERVQHKNVFPYLWHSLQSGIISTMVPITNQKRIKEERQLRKQHRKSSK